MAAAWSREEELTLLLRPSFRSRCIDLTLAFHPEKACCPVVCAPLASYRPGRLQGRSIQEGWEPKGGVFCVSWGETGTQQTGVWVWFLFQEQGREHWVRSTV